MIQVPLAFAFAADPLRPARVDEAFAPTADALAAAGLRVEIYDASRDRITTRGGGLDGYTIVYRGWMLDEPAYAAFVSCVRRAGATPFHDVEGYLAAHHAPRWVPCLAELTPETVFLDEHADLPHELARLDWPGFVLKDWVKSLKTSRGSIVTDPGAAPAVVEEMRKYRGTIEGGLVVRRLEPLRPETERRYFVLDGQPWAASSAQVIPRVVFDAAERITESHFFSVDVAVRSDGALRIVEIGDGQVSDLVGWSEARFVEMWTSR